MDRPLSREPQELRQLEAILADAGDLVRVRTSVGAGALGTPALPVHALVLGSDDPGAPCVGIFAGVHGLERIGSQVVLTYLAGLISRLHWDITLRAQLQAVRLVFMPVVNPGGMARGTRANPAGVDLMRNAPVEAQDRPAFLVGGQRISAGLPWYRGRAGEPMQPEALALCAAVQAEMHSSRFSIAIDCHSGFGMQDRLWFPFAGRRAPFPHLGSLHALHAILQTSYSHHPYVFEPQSSHYLAHGDLWDHLVLHAPAGRTFLPLTLEMGSWLWVKKNPRQFFSLKGLFNPLIEHREQRVLRRHVQLFEFLIRAAAACDQWLPRGDGLEHHRRQGLALWYGDRT